MTSLEKRKFQLRGNSRPSLDHCWVEDVEFLPYNPPVSTTSQDDSASWLSSTEIILSDLKWLLDQPCHIFWSHLIFDDSLRAGLDSFLRLSPREHDGQSTDIRVKSQIEKLQTLYFRVFIRMTTCKESKDDFFDSKVFGSILYDNFILDIPKIIDLCSLFGPSNEKLLVKMVENVFKHQPQYLGDVEAAVPSLSKLFDDMIDRLTDNKLTQPRDLSSPNPESSVADVDLLDMCLYASDMCHSLYMFLHIHPQASTPFHEAQFYKVICLCYDDVLNRLEEQILTGSDLNEKSQKLSHKRLTMAMKDSVKLFRQILFTCTIGKALSRSDLAHQCIQEFYDILSEYLGETRFMSQYASLYPFSDDIDMIDQLEPNSDTTRQCFIRDGLLTAQSLIQTENEPCTQNNQAEDESVDDLSEGGAAAAPASYSDNLDQPSTIKSTATQSVKAMFPDLGDGFIEMCLRQYPSIDEVIHALLEDNLPPALAQLDRTLTEPIEEKTLVTTRKNIFDNDEFDLFRKKDVDMSKVHKGKRGYDVSKKENSYKDKIKSLASNMEALEISKATGVPVSELTSTTAPAAGITAAFNKGLLSSGADMYEDEYDDTYDSNEVGAADADEALDLMGRRMVVPIALGGSGRTAEEEQNEQIQENGNHSQAAGPGAGSRPDQQRRNYDVKGRAKGQGQSADVVHNRNFKTAHKASRANHNRKAGARSKMSKGMF